MVSELWREPRNLMPTSDDTPSHLNDCSRTETTLSVSLEYSRDLTASRHNGFAPLARPDFPKSALDNPR
jgi:hypothetical protein